VRGEPLGGFVLDGGRELRDLIPQVETPGFELARAGERGSPSISRLAARPAKPSALARRSVAVIARAVMASRAFPLSQSPRKNRSYGL
jgi:hypothetical protein